MFNQDRDEIGGGLIYHVSFRNVLARVIYNFLAENFVRYNFCKNSSMKTKTTIITQFFIAELDPVNSISNW